MKEIINQIKDVIRKFNTLDSCYTISIDEKTFSVNDSNISCTIYVHYLKEIIGNFTMNISVLHSIRGDIISYTEGTHVFDTLDDLLKHIELIIYHNSYDIISPYKMKNLGETLKIIAIILVILYIIFVFWV